MSNEMVVGSVNSAVVSRGLTLQEEEDLLKLQISSTKMYYALKTLLESKKLKCLLEVNDKMAFDQAKQAVKLYEDNLFHL